MEVAIIARGGDHATGVDGTARDVEGREDTVCTGKGQRARAYFGQSAAASKRAGIAAVGVVIAHREVDRAAAAKEREVAAAGKPANGRRRDAKRQAVIDAYVHRAVVRRVLVT